MVAVHSQVTGRYTEVPVGNAGDSALSGINATTDIFTISNASCVLMGIFSPDLYAFTLPGYTMHLVEESVLLDSLTPTGIVNGSLDSLAIAWCNGVTCDAASGRWVLADNLDPMLVFHVLADTTFTSASIRLTRHYFLVQAFQDPGWSS